jgi:hypothetical protein
MHDRGWTSNVHRPSIDLAPELEASMTPSMRRIVVVGVAAFVVALGLNASAMSAAAQTPPARPLTAPVRLSLPNAGWALELAAEGFAVQVDQLRGPNNARYFLAHNEATKVNLSAVLETVPSAKSAAQCRALYLGRLHNRQVKMENVRTSELGETAILEYSTNPFGMALPKEKAPELFGFIQKHLNAYLAKDGACIDVHLSKVLARPDEKAEFDTVVGSVRIVDVRR